MFLILLLFFSFCHKNLHIFALPSSAVLKPAQAGLGYIKFSWNGEKSPTPKLPLK
jgi:hypothetical protein